MAKIKACRNINAVRKYVLLKSRSLFQKRGRKRRVPSITPLINFQLSASCSPTAFVYQPDPLILPLAPFCDRKMLLA